MISPKRFILALVAIVFLVGATGFVVEPAYASDCATYHTVRHGQSLYWIARNYGVSWLDLAQVNGIVPPSYVVYPGQVLCIPSGEYYSPYNTPSISSYSPTYYTTGYSNTPQRTWSFSVASVTENASVTVQTYNIPGNVMFKVKIGRNPGGSDEWKDLPDWDTGTGGSFQATFPIPAEFSGTPQLVLRLVQTKKNGMSFFQDQWFSNIPGGTGMSGPDYTPGYYAPEYYPPYYPSGYRPGYYWGIPTIWIVSVVRNSTVTIQTNNFPANINFEVRMGFMHTQGINGYYVGNFNSGAGGTMTLTFNIPPQLYNQYQISIRTQNWWSGYYSYNWFYNNNAY
jgi:LysM repeat protein